MASNTTANAVTVVQVSTVAKFTEHTLSPQLQQHALPNVQFQTKSSQTMSNIASCTYHVDGVSAESDKTGKCWVER